MSNERGPDDPGYDWLYTAPADRPADGREPATSSGPEPTRVLPMPAPPAGRDATPAGPAADEASPASFGGTYPRPDRARATTPAPSPPATAAPAAARYAQPARGRPAGGGAGAGSSSVYQDAQPPGSAPGPPATAPYPARPGRPRRRRRVRWLRIVIAVVVLWALFLVVVPIYAWSKVSKVDAEPSGPRPAAGPGTTYLLVGSDSREGLSPAQERDLGTGAASGQRTDTIILLHVTDGGGPNVLLSIPRDSYVEVPGHGMNKINAAYAFGGPTLLVRTVELATRIRIDDYVEIGFTGVVDVVDAVGGITVCPKTSINDPKAGGLKMQAGCQQVDGHVALDYSRSRAFPLGDITRTLHQREVIAATGSAAASWQTIAFPWRYWNVNLAGANSVHVGANVGPFAFATFAWAMAHSSGSGTKRCVVPFSSLGTSTAVGSVVTWDKPKADAIFNAIRADSTSAVHCTAQ